MTGPMMSSRETMSRKLGRAAVRWSYSGVQQIFLLSPARCDGKRARVLLNPRAEFELAVRLRTQGASIGEVFSFMSGLYFRGKMAYAAAFGRAPAGLADAYVITTDRGLIPSGTVVRGEDLEAFAGVDLGSADARYTAAL